jgi:hypothetical protein
MLRIFERFFKWEAATEVPRTVRALNESRGRECNSLEFVGNRNGGEGGIRTFSRPIFRNL